jgi:hypothetical protein
MPAPTIVGSPNQSRETGVDTVKLNQVSGVRVEAAIGTTSFASRKGKAVEVVQMLKAIGPPGSKFWGSRAGEVGRLHREYVDPVRNRRFPVSIQ